MTSSRTLPSSPRARSGSVETWYSWLVLFVGIVCHIVYFGLTWCVGVYYIIFLEAFHEGSGPTSWIGSINTASMYYIAPIGGILISRFSCRTLIMTGSVLSGMGLFASFYASSIYYLYLTFGVFAGGGIGLAFIPIITLTSRYFDKHRALAMGLCTGGIGVTLVLFPMLINLIRTHFGWRGSLIIFSGLMIQTVALAALAKPIHIPEDDEEDDKEYLLEDASIVQKLQLDVFKNKQYLVLCVSDTMVLFGWSVVLVHLAAYGVKNGVESSWTYTALGLGQLAGRLFFGALGQWKRNDFVLAFIVSVTIAGVSILMMPLAQTPVSIVAVMTIHAFFQGVCGPYIPQMVIEFQGLTRLAPSYGYLLLFEGTGVLLGAPVAGNLYDSTSEYDHSFYLGGASLVLAACLMLPARFCLRQPNTLLVMKQQRLTTLRSTEVLAGSMARLASSRDLHSKTRSYELISRSHLRKPSPSSDYLNLLSEDSPEHKPFRAPIIVVTTPENEVL